MIESNALILKMVVLHNPPRDINLETVITKQSIRAFLPPSISLTIGACLALLHLIQVWFDIRGPERKEKYTAKGHITPQRSVAHDSLLWTASDVAGMCYIISLTLAIAAGTALPYSDHSVTRPMLSSHLMCC
jgi:hypothetical protein